jgi:hypothetical protein
MTFAIDKNKKNQQTNKCKELASQFFKPLTQSDKELIEYKRKKEFKSQIHCMEQLRRVNIV